MHWQTYGFSHWVAKIGEPFGLWFHFAILGDHHRSMWDDTGRCLYIKLGTCVCTWRYRQQRNRLSHHQKFDEPFGARFHFERFLGNRCQVVWKSYSWSMGKKMGKYLHPYIELRTLRVHTYTDSSTKKWTFTLSKFDEPFGVRFHFFRKIFGNRCRLVWMSYSWLDTTRLYIQWLQAYQRKDRLSHYWNFDEPFGVRFHFEKFLREPTSVNVRVVLLVGYDKTTYIMVTRVSTKR